MAEVGLTAQDIARELMVDARRVRLEEHRDALMPEWLGIKVSRDSDQRWRGWKLPIGATALPSEMLVDMQMWVKT